MYQPEISAVTIEDAQPTENAQPLNQNSPQSYGEQYKFDSNIVKYIISTPTCIYTSGKHRLEMEQHRKSKILDLFPFLSVLLSSALDQNCLVISCVLEVEGNV